MRGTDEMSTEWHEYKLTEGSLFVQIRSANIGSVSDRDFANREVLTPRVAITTSPGAVRSDDPLGHLIIRGRQYTVEDAACKRVTQMSYDGEPIRWVLDYSPYGGVYRNDRGKGLAYESKTYGRLNEIVRGVLDQFEADQPDWHRVSERLAFEYERDHWASKAQGYDAKRQAAEAKSAEFQTRIDALA